MKCLILAAGYATRLYPLTENFPKPLLEVGGKAILDHLIEDIDGAVDDDGRPLVDEYIVVSNARFAGIFRDWAASRPRIRVVDDGTWSNETRLGAVRDIQLGIEAAAVADDLFVMAGDNLLSFSLREFFSYARERACTCIMRYWESDERRLHRTGVAEVDADGLVLSMEEKPVEPKSNWCCPPFYFICAEDVPKVAEGIAAGCAVDAPGSFIAWLCARTRVHAWEMPGPRYDIGNLESYAAVKAIFEKE